MIESIEDLQSHIYSQVQLDPTGPQGLSVWTEHHRMAVDIATQEGVRVLQQRARRPVRLADRRQAEQQALQRACKFGLVEFLTLTVLGWLICKALDALLRWWQGEDGAKHIVCSFSIPPD